MAQFACIILAVSLDTWDNVSVEVTVEGHLDPRRLDLEHLAPVGHQVNVVAECLGPEPGAVDDDVIVAIG